MIKNEDAYYTGYYRNVRTLGAIPALVFDTICGLIREKGIGEIANSTLLEMLGIKSKNTLNDAISKIVECGYIEKRAGDGRGNKCIYYLTEKGSKNAPFMNKKGVKICTERGQNLTEKGSKNEPLNKELNKEINKDYSLSSFDGSSNAAKEEEDEIFIKEENINNSVISPEDEQKALEDLKKLFAKSDDEKAREESLKESFAEFWSLFNPEEAQKCKYKVAQNYWINEMEEYRREAALKVLKRGMKSNEKNPFFFLQHFSPVRFFLVKKNDQYQLAKDGAQLCRVRWKDEQRIIAAYWADVFEMEILDDHYEKRFEI